MNGVGTLFYFENEVKYIQKVKYKKLDKIKASLFYQTCDHETCERETTENVLLIWQRQMELTLQVKRIHQ